MKFWALIALSFAIIVWLGIDTAWWHRIYGAAAVTIVFLARWLGTTIDRDASYIVYLEWWFYNLFWFTIETNIPFNIVLDTVCLIVLARLAQIHSSMLMAFLAGTFCVAVGVHIMYFDSVSEVELRDLAITLNLIFIVWLFAIGGSTTYPWWKRPFRLLLSHDHSMIDGMILWMTKK